MTFLAANPVVLFLAGVLAAVTALAFGAAWLIENWETVEAWFASFWARLLAGWEDFKGGFIAGWQGLADEVSGVLHTITFGLLGDDQGEELKEGLKRNLDRSSKLLPKSDAEEGPFSELTKSGAAIMETIAAGVTNAGGDALKRAIAASVALLPPVTVDVAAQAATAIQGQEIAPLGVETPRLDVDAPRLAVDAPALPPLGVDAPDLPDLRVGPIPPLTGINIPLPVAPESVLAPPATSRPPAEAGGAPLPGTGDVTISIGDVTIQAEGTGAEELYKDAGRQLRRQILVAFQGIDSEIRR